MEVQSNQNLGYCESCHQCDYEIEYADHSSSMGVLARDEMYLTVANGDKTKLDFVFGYDLFSFIDLEFYNSSATKFDFILMYLFLLLYLGVHMINKVNF